jgi:hypothetical protein
MNTNTSFESSTMYELSAAEIDMVAGGDALGTAITNLFNTAGNVFGAISILIPGTPAAAAWNTVVGAVNSELGSLASGNLATIILSPVTAALAGGTLGIQTVLSVLGLTTSGSAGANSLYSTLESVIQLSISNVLQGGKPITIGV